MSGESVLERLGIGSARIHLRPLEPVEGSLPEPSRRGRYEVHGEIARGGVGVVLRGHDVDLGREVALKRLRSSYAENEDLVRRFVEEAQVGGQLQHPGVVPVYELGVGGDDLPFFAMKLVKGTTLADVLDDREEPSSQRHRLLTAFAQVCDTMAYAHARGVIHRDLKPANVMLGAYGVVQIVDWGFAKVLPHGGVADERRARRAREEPRDEPPRIETLRSTAEGSASLAGEVFGTPAYMPPEQALGRVDDLDRRTDVFALGAILCEILTGEPPYSGEPADAHAQAARGETAESLARLDASGADPELVELTVRCLARERRERPHDARALAEAVSSHLAGVNERARRAEVEALEARSQAAQARSAADEARVAAQAARTEATEDEARIERARARAASAVEAAAESRRSRRQTLVVAAAALLVLLVGGGVWVWFDRRQARVRREATERVEERIAEARRAIGTPPRWGEAIAAAESAVELASHGGSEETRARADAALLEVRAGKADGDRRVAARSAAERLFRAIGTARGALERHRDHSRFDRDLERACAEAGIDLAAPERAAARIRESEMEADLLDMLVDWMIRRAARLGRDDARVERLLAIAAALDPEGASLRLWLVRGDLPMLRAAAKGESGDPNQAFWIGRALSTRGEKDLAADLLRRAHAANPGDFWTHVWLAEALRDRDQASAVEHLTAAIALRPDAAWIRLERGMDQRDPFFAERDFREAMRLEPDNVYAHTSLGVALARQGHVRSGLECQRRAVAIDSENALAHSNLGGTLGELEQYEEALEACREALRLAPRMTVARLNLGRYLALTGRTEEGLRILRETREAEPENPLVHAKLARTLLDVDELELAEKAYREALRLDLAFAPARVGLTLIFLERGELEAALDEAREAVALRPDLASARLVLARVLRRQGNQAAALEAYRVAVRLQPGSASCRAGLAETFRAAGEVDRALATAREAVALDEKSALAHLALANALATRGRHAEALAEFDRSLELDPADDVTHFNRGNSLVALDRWDEAAASFAEARDLNPTDAAVRLNLGRSLLQLGRTEEAVVEAREAVRLAPEDAISMRLLGQGLFMTGQVEEGLAVYRQAIGLEPDNPTGHYNLGIFLAAVGRLDEAIAAEEEAVRLDPEIPEALCNLAGHLSQRGEFVRALALFRRAHEIGSRQPGFALPTARLVRKLEALVELEKRLPAVIRGEDEPTSPDERTALAYVARCTGFVAAGARLLAGNGLESEPDPRDRYDAAVCAVRAGCGQGEDAGTVPEADRSRWRAKALDWLTLELDRVREGLRGGDGSVNTLLVRWRHDRSLAGVRDRDRRAALPDEEREAWETFWREFDELVERR